ncbi:hypothetical protein [Streptococcus sp.]|uniref:hypothetical protein n=1 Tax=Streptococcus sp. TaxID=1306 RepID=UPI0026DD09A7|nr:hypothetical protein [Streptococcus sp.]MDO4659786.1 hypothetical protein [Streptococcus sp.]
MATTAQVGILSQNNTARLIEVASDGYPDYIKPLLIKYYNTLESVNELLENGNLMYLEKSLEESPKDKVITTVEFIRYVGNVSDFGTKRMVVDYRYIFKEEDKTWYMINNGNFIKL